MYKHTFMFKDSNGQTFGVGSVLKVGKKIWDVVYRYDLLQVMLKRRDESVYKYLWDSEHQHWEVITPEFLEVDFTKGNVLPYTNICFPKSICYETTVITTRIGTYGIDVLGKPVAHKSRNRYWEDLCRTSFLNLGWFYIHTDKEKVFPLR